MYFDSFSAVLHMAGHGPYVWSAYALTSAIIVALIVNPLVKARAAQAALRAEVRRREAAAASLASNVIGSQPSEVEDAPKA